MQLIDMVDNQLVISVEPSQLASRTQESESSEPSRKGLQFHAKSYCDVGVFVCHVCGKSFTKARNLTLHLLVHEDTLPHVCVVCNKGFRAPSQLRYHKLLHIKQRQFVCEFCKKGFVRSSELRKHACRRHAQEVADGWSFVCATCGKKFDTVGTLTHHELTHGDTSSFVCKCCGKAFAYRKALRSHEKIHSAYRPFVCATCGKDFRDQKDFRRHVITHMGDAEKCFVCDVCEKRFYEARSLRKHAETHTERARSIVCDICQKTFFDVRILRKHIMNTHEGRKDFRCDICGKAFNRKGTLKLHMNIHSDVKVFECDLCGRRFNHMRSTIRHKELRHKMDRQTATRTTKKHMRTNGEAVEIKTAIDSIALEPSNNLTSLTVSRTEKDRELMKCSFCEKTFGNRSSLEYHKSLHQRLPKIFRSGAIVEKCEDALDVLSELLQTVIRDGKDSITQDSNGDGAANCFDVARNTNIYTSGSNYNDDLTGALTEQCTHDLNELQSSLSTTRELLSKHDRLIACEPMVSSLSIGRPRGLDTGSELLVQTEQTELDACIKGSRDMTVVIHNTAEQAATYMSDTADKVTENNVSENGRQSQIEICSELPHICDVCDKWFAFADDLEQHLRCKHSKPSGELVCPNCNKTFSRYDSLQHHITKDICVKTITRNIVCGNCNKTFGSRKGLFRHKKRVCCNVSSSADIVTSEAVEGAEDVKCNHRDEAIRQKPNIQKVCASCNRVFSTHAALRKHTTSGGCNVTHTILSEQAVEGTKQDEEDVVVIRDCVDCSQGTAVQKQNVPMLRMYKCKSCDKTLYTSGGLWKHKKICHDKDRHSILSGQASAGAVNIKNEDGSIGRLASCEKSKSLQYVSHGRAAYTGDGKHVCEICKRHFRFKSNLNKHRLIHSEIKRWKCENCNKRFRRGQHLRGHQKTCKQRLLQNSTHPHVCANCNKRFRVLKYLRKHEWRRTCKKADSQSVMGGDDSKERSRECSNLAFSHRYKQLDGTLQPDGKAHRRKVACMDCGRAFSKNKYLQQHKQRGSCHAISKGLSDAVVGRAFSDVTISHQVKEVGGTTQPDGETNRRRVACIDCGRMFSKNKYLQQHKQRGSCHPISKGLSGAVVEGKPDINDSTVFNQRWACQNCKAIFARRVYLRRHERGCKRRLLKSAQGHALVCKLCGQRFKELRYLLRHELRESCRNQSSQNVADEDAMKLSGIADRLPRSVVDEEDNGGNWGECDDDAEFGSTLARQGNDCTSMNSTLVGNLTISHVAVVSDNQVKVNNNKRLDHDAIPLHKNEQYGGTKHAIVCVNCLKTFSFTSSLARHKKLKRCRMTPLCDVIGDTELAAKCSLQNNPCTLEINCSPQSNGREMDGRALKLSSFPENVIRLMPDIKVEVDQEGYSNGIFVSIHDEWDNNRRKFISNFKNYDKFNDPEQDISKNWSAGQHLDVVIGKRLLCLKLRRCDDSSTPLMSAARVKNDHRYYAANETTADTSSGVVARYASVERQRVTDVAVTKKYQKLVGNRIFSLMLERCDADYSSHSRVPDQLHAVPSLASCKRFCDERTSKRSDVDDSSQSKTISMNCLPSDGSSTGNHELSNRTSQEEKKDSRIPLDISDSLLTTFKEEYVSDVDDNALPFEETHPEETHPEETRPEETRPEETRPEETHPKETHPEDPCDVLAVFDDMLHSDDVVNTTLISNEQLLEPTTEMVCKPQSYLRSKIAIKCEDLITDDKDIHHDLDDSCDYDNKFVDKHPQVKQTVPSDTGEKDRCEKELQPDAGTVRSYLERLHILSAGQRQNCRTDRSCLCPVCGKCFASSLGLRQHEKNASHVFKTTIASLETDVVNSVWTKSRLCNLCGESFAYSHLLRQHVKNVHASEQSSRFTCEVCKKRLNCAAALKVHMKRHRGQKDFSCDVCGDGFVRKSDLYIHLNKHSTVPLFQCDICARGFRFLSSLDRHQKVHQKIGSGGMMKKQRSFRIAHCTEKESFLDHSELSFGAETINSFDSFDAGVQKIHHITNEILSSSSEHVSLCQCKICGKKCRHPRELKLHELYQHKKAKFSCEICDKGFVDIRGLTRHMLKCHSDKKYPCDLCHKTFRTPFQMKWHSQNFHGDGKPFTCEICARTFKTLICLNMHSQGSHGRSVSDSDTKQWVCQICKKGFDRSDTLRRHEIICKRLMPPTTVDEENSAWAAIEQKDSSSLAIAETLVKSDKKVWVCEKCKSVFSIRCNLVRHLNRCNGEQQMRSEHLNDRYNSTTNTWVCEHCQKEYPSRFRLWRHDQIHRKTEWNKRKRKISDPSSVSNTCSICNKSLSSVKHLIRHVQRIHSDGNFPCEICKKNFKCLFYLKRHVQNHVMHTLDPNQHRKFGCEVCDKKFTTRDLLLRHSPVHTGLRQFICKICQKGFKTAAHLTQHAVVHSDARPWVCEICKMGFNRQNNLRRHEILCKLNLTLSFNDAGSSASPTVEQKHSIKSGNDSLNSTKSVWGSQHCNKKLPSGYRLLRHRQMHRKTKQSLASLAIDAKDSVPPVMLHNCSTQQADVASKDPLVCPNCNKRFSSAHSMRSHKWRRRCKMTTNLNSSVDNASSNCEHGGEVEPESDTE